MAFSDNNNTSQPMNQGYNYHPMNNVTSFDRQFLHWSFIIMEVGAIVVIVIGDISMLMLFFTRKLLGQSTNILVFSVAIGDLLNGVLTFPLAMLQKILYEPSEFMCKGYFYLANVSKTAVGYSILLLGLERITAVLSCTYRILPPGRCLFFASLTWFFSAAYNIWSVVIYDMETVEIPLDISEHQLATVSGFSICFASTRFMYLHTIFEYLNPLVTFAFPAVSSSALFVGFWVTKDKGDKPGRPYKSSKSVVIFIFALLVSFLATHLPWEIANLVFTHDARYHSIRELMVLKILHIITFSRGFWDIFIFGAFRRYVCKKEKALAHFREQRSLHVQRSSLSIPINDRPVSLSLLDSDPSVSRRYSSDNTISRRPSAMDDVSVCSGEMHQINSAAGASSKSGYHATSLIEVPNRRKSTIITTTIITDHYLAPRSPCLHDNYRRFSFAPPQLVTSDFPTTVDELHIPKTRIKNDGVSASDSKPPLSPSNESKECLDTSAETFPNNICNSDTCLPLPTSSTSSSTLSSISKTVSASSTAATLQVSTSTVTSSLPLSLSQSSQSLKAVPETDLLSSKNSLFPPSVLSLPPSTTKVQQQKDAKMSRRKSMPNVERNSRRKFSLFLETSFDLSATSPTTTAVTIEKDSSVYEF